jgi:hypothetical protein
MNSHIFGNAPYAVDHRIASTHVYGGTHTGQIQHSCPSSGNRKCLFSVRSVRVLMRQELFTYWKNQVCLPNNKTLYRPGHISSGKSLVCHRGEPDSLPRQPMCGLWWTKWPSYRSISDYFGSYLSFVMPSMFRSYSSITWLLDPLEVAVLQRHFLIPPRELQNELCCGDKPNLSFMWFLCTSVALHASSRLKLRVSFCKFLVWLDLPRLNSLRLMYPQLYRTGSLGVKALEV